MTDEQKTQTQVRIDAPSSIQVELKLPSAQELLDAGVHFGHKTSRWHPKMKQYIFTAKGTSHVFDLEKTVKKLEEALIFMRSLVARGGTILFVGTKPAAKKVVREAALALNAPYVTERWLGGTLTNFKTITKRLQYWRELSEGKASGAWEKYTKKERLQFQKQMDKLEKQLGGIKNLFKLPDTIFVVDIKTEELAVREAKKVGTPVVAICDTNVDPSSINYVIPANDDASSSLKKILEIVVENLKDLKLVIAEPEKKSSEVK